MENLTKVVIGLGFGDEGKGMAVAHEVERAIGNGLDPVVVRFNGGPQAQHNVRVRREGKVVHHTHSQFGSGALLGAETIIASGMLFDPMAFAYEACAMSSLVDDVRPVKVDCRCPVVLPFHRLANVTLEKARGDGRHGSTGRGIGVARTCESAVIEGKVSHDMLITVSDLSGPKGRTYDKMRFWTRWIEDRFGIDMNVTDGLVWTFLSDVSGAMEIARDRYMHVIQNTDDYVRHMLDDETKGVVFEGSQGILLDERYGWFPHVTYGDLTASGATRLIGHRPFSVMGVTRSYSTRHGAGPLPSEGTMRGVHETDNVAYEWAGEFRVGVLDMPTLSRAARAAQADEVAVSHVDRYPGGYVTRWNSTVRIDGCDRDVPTEASIWAVTDVDSELEQIERSCAAPVTVVGSGPTTDDWHDR